MAETGVWLAEWRKGVLACADMAKKHGLYPVLIAGVFVFSYPYVERRSLENQIKEYQAQIATLKIEITSLQGQIQSMSQLHSIEIDIYKLRIDEFQKPITRSRVVAR